jgi:tape measure domain-containing protein
MAENLGASFTIDITQLKAGLAQANRLIRESESEFRAAAAGMDDWTKSQEGLEKKIKSLTDIAGVQEKKVEALKAEYNRLISEGLDPTSAKATDLRTKINKETEALNKSKAELEKQTAALKVLQSESSDTEQKTESLTDKVKKQEKELKTLKSRYTDVAAEQGDTSDEAKELAKQISDLSGELKENKTKLKEAADAADELDQSIEDAADSAESAGNGGFTIFKGVVADLASNAIQSLVGSIKDLAGEAIDASDSMYKFEQTMGFAGYDSKTIEQASKDVKDYADKTVYNLDTIANTTAQLAANGVKDYTALTQAAGNLNAVAGGNSDTFNSVAMVLTQTAGAGKLTTENWNQLANAIPGASGRLMDALKDAGAYTGDFREAMSKGEITADEFNDALLKLGSEPVAVEAATSTATFEGAMGDLQATAVSGLMDIYSAIGRENITKLINKISGLVKKIVPPIKAAIQWFIDHLPEIKIALVALGTATAAYLAYTTAVTVMTQCWMALSVAQKAVTAAQAAMNAVMNLNPIGLIVAAIAGLVAAFVLLWNKSEAFREFWIELWDSIKDTVSTAWDAITGFFSAAWEKIKAVFAPVGEFFTAIWDGIKSALKPFIDWFVAMFKWAWDTIKGVWNAVVYYFTAIWEGIKSVFTPIISWFSDKFTAAWNGIKAAFSAAGESSS